jgi:PAS domain S-box-containing protein
MRSSEELIAELRRRAEEQVRHKGYQSWGRDLQRLAHELEVHQCELQLQNEELLRTQSLLEDARDRYCTLYDTAPVGFVTLDPRGRVLEANVTAARLLHRPVHDVVGSALSQFLSAADADRLYLQCRAIFAGESVSSLEVRFNRPTDGGWFPARLDAAIAENGDVQVCHMTILDLTAERRAEQELRVREAELRERTRLFESMASRIEDVFYVADSRGATLRYVSPAFRAVFGRTAASALKSRGGWLIWVHPEDRMRLVEGRDRLGERGVIDLEYRVLRPDDAMRIVRDRAYLLAEEGMLTGVVQDITEERRLEREVETRHAEKMEAVGSLASGIAHDFNNLLMGLIGFNKLALGKLTQEHPAYRLVDRSLRAAERGTNLTSELMNFSGKRVRSGHPIELDAVVKSAESLLQSLLGEHFRQRFDLAAPGCHIRADAGDIQQILMNLASNARDAMTAGGELAISTAAEETSLPDGNQLTARPVPCVRLAVRDTGVGISPEVRRRIFEPFFTTKPVGQGTGLGLSTVFAIVHRLGARIEVESEVGSGSCFSLIFPTVERDPDSEKDVTSRESHLCGVALLVEDNELVRTTVESYLSGLGYRVFAASHPSEALDCAREIPALDLLVTDVVMPDMLGPELAAAVRLCHADAQILFMSAHPKEELEVTRGLHRIENLIEKPFDERALSRALQRGTVH